MIGTRTIAIAVGLALLVGLGTGCTSRRDKALIDELREDNQRLSSELNKLRDEANDLQRERNIVRDENAKLREQAEGLSHSLADLVKTGGLESDAIEIEDDHIALNQDVAFNSGSATLKEAGLSAIRSLAAELNKAEYKDTVVIIEGHTDTTPVSRPATKDRFGTNWGLSAMRAASVIDALQAAGVAPERLRGSFRGQYSPRKGVPVSQKAKHRRVEIYLGLLN